MQEAFHNDKSDFLHNIPMLQRETSDMTLLFCPFSSILYSLLSLFYFSLWSALYLSVWSQLEAAEKVFFLSSTLKMTKTFLNEAHI